MQDVVPTFPAGASVASLPDHIRALSKAGRDNRKGKAPDRASSSATASSTNPDVANAASSSIVMSSISSTATQGDKTDSVAVAQAGERFLRALRDVWDDHEACVRKLKDVLKYVVSPVIGPTHNVRSLTSTRQSLRRPRIEYT